MKTPLCTMTASAVLAGSVLSAAAPATATISEPGQFELMFDAPGTAEPAPREPLCAVSGTSEEKSLISSLLDSLLPALMAGESVTVDCDVYTSLEGSNQTMTGTVTNAALGLTGTVTKVCNSSYDVDAGFGLTFAPPATNPTMSVPQIDITGWESCSWAMAFTDPEASKLSGTIEATVSGTSSSSAATTAALSIDVVADVVVTGGTGQFAKSVGTGTYEHHQSVDLDIPSVPTAGDGFSPMSVMAVGASDPMTLQLSEGKVDTEITAPPVPTSGPRWFGTAPDGSPMTLTVATTPGARCKVSVGRTAAKVNKVLINGKAKSKKARAKGYTKSGVLTTNITSTKIANKLNLSRPANAVIKAQCWVKSKSATDKAVVRLS